MTIQSMLNQTSEVVFKVSVRKIMIPTHVDISTIYLYGRGEIMYTVPGKFHQEGLTYQKKLVSRHKDNKIFYVDVDKHNKEFKEWIPDV